MKESKEKAKLIFKEPGITMGDAFNMLLSQVNLHHGIPFEIKIPNETTKKVIKDFKKVQITDGQFEKFIQFINCLRETLLYQKGQKIMS